MAGTPRPAQGARRAGTAAPPHWLLPPTSPFPCRDQEWNVRDVGVMMRREYGARIHGCQPPAATKAFAAGSLATVTPPRDQPPTSGSTTPEMYSANGGVRSGSSAKLRRSPSPPCPRTTYGRGRRRKRGRGAVCRRGCAALWEGRSAGDRLSSAPRGPHQDAARQILQGCDLAHRTPCNGFLGHAEDDAGGLVLGIGVGTRLLHL